MTKPTPHDFGLSETRIAALKQELAAFEVAKGAHPEKLLKFTGRFAQRGAVFGLVCGLLLCLNGLVFPGPKAPPDTVGFICGAVFLAPALAFVGMLAGVVVAEVVESKRKELRPPERPPDHARLLDYEKALCEWEESERNALREREECERIALREREECARRKAGEFWMALDGWEFERQIATLYRNQRFEVEETPGSGDGGVDLILRREGKKWIVQCKQHANPVPPTVVRDLFGTMVHERADAAILVATAGFTPGTREFAAEKPITLVDLDDILKMARGPESAHETSGTAT